MYRFWKNYNLSIVLFLMFLFSWGLQTWTGWNKFADEQKQHGQTQGSQGRQANRQSQGSGQGQVES